MQCYTQLLPPSAVTHAVALPFLNAHSRNLVVVKTCLLQVFRSSTVTNNEEGSERSSKSKLVLIGEYPLAGTVTSLAAIKAENTKSGGDALLIAFKDAKLSLVEWDPDNYRLSTISIHYYEGENVINEPFGPSLSESESILTVDPTSRCAALKFGAKHLAILPFRQVGDELAEDGEDGFDGEMDDAPPSAPLKRTQSGMNEVSADEGKQTPYKSSFVLPLTTLDPALTHPVDLAFLHEYREPTFGILSAPVQPSAALIEARKDILSYSVFTLDLDQRASTNLISAQKLPSDLWKVVPLPLPVGGALLVGTNELVHVDQSGKMSAVAVNEYAKLASNLAMTDQSDLNMKLEGCEIGELDTKTGDLLIVLNDGSMAVLSFRVLGRNVGGLKVTRVSAESGGASVEVAPSAVAPINTNTFFVGSEDGDSSLISWSKSSSSLSRKRSHAQMLDQAAAVEEDEDSESLDEDDLYATAPEPAKRTSSSGAAGSAAAASYTFELQDRLASLGPINNICLGRSQTSKKDLELVAGVGRGKGSRLATIRKESVPTVVRTEEEVFKDAKNVWSMSVNATQSAAKVESKKAEHDSLLFCFDGEQTRIYDVNPASEDSSRYNERTGTEFEHDGETLQMASTLNGTRIVQCRRSEVRIYTAADLSLSQIIPMSDDETDAELNIVHASFSDPYMLVLRDDSSVMVLQADKSGDMEPLDNTDPITERKWLSGCLYTGSLCPNETIVCLLGEEGGLHMFNLPDLQQFYHAPTLRYLPPVLEAGAQQRRVGAKETLTELLLTDIGTEDVKEPYLVVRSAMDDLTLYQPWSATSSWKEILRFRKVPLDYIPKFDDSGSEGDGPPAPLRHFRLGRYSAVLIPGASPSFVLKESTSLPKVLSLRARDVKTTIPLHLPGRERGFGLLRPSPSPSPSSSGEEPVTATCELQECTLPEEAEFSTGWCVHKQTLGHPAEEVREVAYHEGRGMYVVATCRDVDFLPEGEKEDGGRGKGDEASLHPQVPQYTLHLLSAKTRQTIHSYPMPYLETITSLKIMPLEISEQSHEVRSRIVVGTATQRGEDHPAKGALSVFEILSVVPDPHRFPHDPSARAETGLKLSLVSREETRGAITVVESFPGGLIGTGQGQKLMIRGLKEDGSCLPVAFLDAQCYTTSLKHLAGSGLWLAADAWKGLWFGGFTQEPYKLTTLGKSRTRMEVVSAEFLPFDGDLFILVVDAAMDLHVLQYDPENPKSLSGTRLLHRSTFHLGQFATSTTLLPSSLLPVGAQPVPNGHANGEADTTQILRPSLYHVLLTSLSGAVGLVTPLDEGTYRRLALLQTQLSSVLEHAAGLNPRAYRAVGEARAGGLSSESEGLGARGIVDGEVVKRIWELGSARRVEVLGRAGMDGWGLRSDLEAVGGGGVGYL